MDKPLVVTADSSWWSFLTALSQYVFEVGQNALAEQGGGEGISAPNMRQDSFLIRET